MRDIIKDEFLKLVKVEKNTRGDYTAEIDLSNLNAYIIGIIYSYGDTEEKAMLNLGSEIEITINKLNVIV